MATIGIRDLKGRLSEFVSRAARGESVLVTDHGHPVALLGPLTPSIKSIEVLRQEGRISWGGGKPNGIEAGSKKRRAGLAYRRASGRAPNVSGAVVENRKR